MLDPVGALGAGVGQSGLAPRATRLRSSRRAWSAREGRPGHTRCRTPQPGADFARFAAAGGGGAQRAEFLLGDPGGEDLAGGVVVDQTVPHSGQRAGGEPFAGAQQQPPVRPGRIAGPAAALNSSRVTRCRTAVTAELASMIRWNIVEGEVDVDLVPAGQLCAVRSKPPSWPTAREGRGREVASRWSSAGRRSAWRGFARVRPGGVCPAADVHGEGVAARADRWPRRRRRPRRCCSRWHRRPGRHEQGPAGLGSARSSRSRRVRSASACAFSSTRGSPVARA